MISAKARELLVCTDRLMKRQATDEEGDQAPCIPLLCAQTAAAVGRLRLTLGMWESAGRGSTETRLRSLGAAVRSREIVVAVGAIAVCVARKGDCLLLERALESWKLGWKLWFAVFGGGWGVGAVDPRLRLIYRPYQPTFGLPDNGHRQLASWWDLRTTCSAAQTQQTRFTAIRCRKVAAFRSNSDRLVAQQQSQVSPSILPPPALVQAQDRP